MAHPFFFFDSTEFRNGQSITITIEATDNLGGVGSYTTPAVPCKNVLLLAQYPDPEMDPEPAVVVSNQFGLDSGYGRVWLEGGWSPTAFVDALDGPNVAFYSGHGKPSMFWAGQKQWVPNGEELMDVPTWVAPSGDDGYWEGTNLLVQVGIEPHRIPQMGAGLPPFNSTGTPPVNLAFLECCETGQALGFIKFLFPYENALGGLLENQAFTGFTVRIFLRDYAEIAFRAFSHLSGGFCLWSARARLVNTVPAIFPDRGPTPYPSPLTQEEVPIYGDSAARVSTVIPATPPTPSGGSGWLRSNFLRAFVLSFGFLLFGQAYAADEATIRAACLEFAARNELRLDSAEVQALRVRALDQTRGGRAFRTWDVSTGRRSFYAEDDGALSSYSDSVLYSRVNGPEAIRHPQRGRPFYSSERALVARAEQVLSRAQWAHGAEATHKPLPLPDARGDIPRAIVYVRFSGRVNGFPTNADLCLVGLDSLSGDIVEMQRFPGFRYGPPTVGITAEQARAVAAAESQVRPSAYVSGPVYLMLSELYGLSGRGRELCRDDVVPLCYYVEGDTENFFIAADNGDILSRWANATGGTDYVPSSRPKKENPNAAFIYGAVAVSVLAGVGLLAWLGWRRMAP